MFFAELTNEIMVKKQIAAFTQPEAIRAFGEELYKKHHTIEWQLKLMLDLNKRKFTEYPILGSKLKETDNNTLENGLLYNDAFWGTYKGSGANHLGKILMKIREELFSKE